MREIKLTNRDAFVMVDEDDYGYLIQFKWSLSNTGYAVRYIYREGKTSPIMMHRELMGDPIGLDIDHKDGDRLNNTRINLRTATRKQNVTNRRKMDGTSSRFKGVSWISREQKWRAYIKQDRKQIYLGRYLSEIDAALAYNAKALELFGEFARLNIIPEEASYEAKEA